MDVKPTDVTCTHSGAEPGRLFCSNCGTLLDPDGLKRVKLQGFTGPASLVPSIEKFWETGDPSDV